MTRDWRALGGSLGFYAGVLGLLLIAVALTIVFGPAKDSAMDRFVVQHIALFRGILWAVFFSSPISLVSSLCGKGMKRGFGTALSLVNFLFSISILGAGQ